MDVEQVRTAAVVSGEDGVPVLRVVDVLGRRSGESRPVVLNVLRLGGDQYVCAPDPHRDWVRNLLASGYCRIERDGPDARDSVRRVRRTTATEAARVLGAQGRAAVSPFTDNGGDDPDQTRTGTATRESKSTGTATEGVEGPIVLRLEALD